MVLVPVDTGPAAIEATHTAKGVYSKTEADIQGSKQLHGTNSRKNQNQSLAPAAPTP